MEKQQRVKVLWFLILGYGAYQLMRLNMGMIAPSLKEELGFTNTDIGLIFSAFTLVYAGARIVSGMLADRLDPRFFLFVGLIGSCVCNFVFGLSDILANFILFWGINAFFQSAGAPSCARMLKHTVDKKQYGTYWALWSMNAPIGGAIAFLFLSFVIPSLGWRVSTFLSIGFCVVMGLIFYYGMNRFDMTFQYAGRRDTDQTTDAKTFVKYFKEVYSNKLFLRVCFAGFCLYSIRVGLFNWFPQIMREVKGAEIKLTGIMSAVFEVGSLAGGLLAGWVSDKYFAGHRGKVGFFYMFATAIVLALLWFVPIESSFIYTCVVLLFGFLAFGPQVLAGVSALDYASHKTVGIATGSISLLGYTGATFTSFILGPISDYFGWGWGFVLTIVLALLGSYFFYTSVPKGAKPQTK